MTTNTGQSFRDKWTKNPGAFYSETLREGSEILTWILSRNGFAKLGEFAHFLQGKRRILDAGCGNGRVTALLRCHSDPARTQVVGIDLVAADVARANLGGQPNIAFYAKDLLGELSDLGEFDFIYCQEVLHHTADPKRAFLNLCDRLAPDGEIAIYVYKQKAPVREFVDDFVRERISGLPYEAAMQVAREITDLGRALAEPQLKVKVPAVPILDIQAGEYDLQRFVYHFFMKCFWNPDLTYDENVVINYDWYHPQLASRHTLPEVKAWFREAELDVVHTHVDFYGITVRGVRRR